jgi:addiction module HigA family antidote
MLMSLLKEPMHPGEVLKELYLAPLELGAFAFGRRLGVPRTRIDRLIKGTTGMTSDMALRLACVFNTTPAGFEPATCPLLKRDFAPCVWRVWCVSNA